MSRLGSWPRCVPIAGGSGLRVVALLGVSLPAFWLAILFQIFFGLRLGWLPVSGRLASLAEAPPASFGLYTVDSLVSGQWATFMIACSSSCCRRSPELPAMATIMLHPGDAARDPGSGLRAHRAGEGSHGTPVVTRHALRNALIPTVTMVGLSFGWAMGGSVLVETVFDWPGLGLYATKSALSLDFMPIMGIALLYGLVFSVINILVDVTYGRARSPGEPGMSAEGAIPTLVRAAPEAPRRSFLGLGERQRRALRQFRQSPLSMVGLAIIFVLLAIAVVGPFFVPYPDDVSGR